MHQKKDRKGSHIRNRNNIIGMIYIQILLYSVLLGTTKLFNWFYFSTIARNDSLS